ncbi:hypothetical protein [Planotetraspora mira]|uniref:hypothetical protein n=1 Tax=Planotetraspora mira TaxID=58121 RepID=UPI0019501F81|nr:hypothetical protein [Planotetraspora mira]
MGAITFIVDGEGRRLGAVVPTEVVEQALRLRMEAEAIEIREVPQLHDAEIGPRSPKGK